MLIRFYCLLFVVSAAIAQDLDRIRQLEDLKLPREQASITQPTGMALESTVDPERYYVGPSDVIAVNVWMSPPLNYNLTVTPEGTLIVPMVGEVRVGHLTLAKAKERILAEARKKYLSAEITATLVRPRPIVVSVSGNVLNPGLYTLSAVDRANRAIDEANRLTLSQTPGDLNPILGSMSMRNVVLKHRDGTQDRVDIVKYFATHEDQWNPYLREGDMVVVPRKNPLKNVFGIYGEVNAPGRYEFVSGDSLHDAIEIGQGFTPLAITDGIEFSRQSEDGTTLTQQILNADDIIGNHRSDFALLPGDRIVVKARQELREDYRVSIVGEVIHPGVYPITKDHTKLSEVIRQAGGFTAFAALKAAVLNRRSVDPGELTTERLLSFRGGVSAEDSSDYFLETELRLRKEIVNVDFEKLFLKNDSTQDIILRNEDYIVIPSITKTIYVFGQIVSPGHIPFVSGEDPEYYVRMAGGFTDRAREGDLKIIKNKTKQWLDPDETMIEEGDYIWVPKHPDRPFAYYMTVASQAASVLSVVIGIAVIIVQVTQ